MSGLKKYEYELIRGLTDWQLRTLYNESRSEMKHRSLLIYDETNGEFSEAEKEERQKHYGIRSLPKSDGFIRLDKSIAPLQSTFTKKLFNPSCSILSYWLSEDWSFLFSENLNDERKYYVYYHFDPTSNKQSYSNPMDGYRLTYRFAGMPFYIGKGTGDRSVKMNGRNTAHISRVSTFEKLGYDINSISLILCDGLTEIEAFELESKLISFFGCMAEIPKNRTYFHGQQGGMLINSDIGKRPEWVSKLIHSAVTRVNRKKKVKSNKSN